MELVQSFLDQNTKVIDLGADFRLKDLDDWERVYGRKHKCPDVVQEAVYGIPELHRGAIEPARVDANPGCFASAAILGMAPMIKAGIVEADRIIVDGRQVPRARAQSWTRRSIIRRSGTMSFPITWSITATPTRWSRSPAS